MKKFSYLLAVAVLSVTAFVGCSKSKTEAPATTDAPATEAPVTSEVPATTEAPAATEIEITHSLGTVTVPVNPKKAVIFDFGVLDTVKSLGVEVELAVAVSSLPEYLSEYGNSVNAGTLKSPDMEAIFDFEPEVIIISGRQSSYYEELSKIAPTVYVELDSTKYMEDFKHNVNLVADIFGVKELAEQKIAEIDTLVDAAIAEIALKEEKGLILLTNDGSISVYGIGSRFGLIHDLLGVKPADDSIVSSTHGQEANFEYISQVNPDIMFVVDRTEAIGGDVANVSVLDNALVNETNAAKNNKIVKLNPDYWYLSGGGIISVTGMINEIADVMK